YERAAWTAENALAVDLDCAEAKQILERARAQLASQKAAQSRKDDDDTVDLTNQTERKVEPDDTVSLTRPAGVWERVAGMFRKLTHTEGAVDKDRQADNPQRMKT